jgi:hypothetical protein
MDRTKYIGMDVHQASISIAVRDSQRKTGNGVEQTTTGEKRKETGWID